jgi:hypothetical protein
MSRPQRPPQLVALLAHRRGCKECQVNRGCTRGLALMRAWLVYEEARKTQFSPPV